MKGSHLAFDLSQWLFAEKIQFVTLSKVENKLPLEDITRGALPLRLHIGSQSQFICVKLKLT